ncbi:hypothetical protein CDAR_185661 [Caerostris darwini]|uniref:Uncharacterized protein n=1 Tax=Caerostris darwini TaxID=1538125 RepID=A0AAV4TB80_9ARAC|nr:hypothetical protein CDAR_185661 [Caerostris darwini]
MRDDLSLYSNGILSPYPSHALVLRSIKPNNNEQCEEYKVSKSSSLVIWKCSSFKLDRACEIFPSTYIVTVQRQQKRKRQIRDYFSFRINSGSKSKVPKVAVRVPEISLTLTPTSREEEKKQEKRGGKATTLWCQKAPDISIKYPRIFAAAADRIVGVEAFLLNHNSNTGV